MTNFNPTDFLVLVVDDAATNLQVVGEMLDLAGYGTTYATSGEQALQRLTTLTPDLILLDLMMPDLSGIEVCEKLQAQPQWQDIPVIFLTASNQKTHLIDAFAKGAVDYVTKPFEPVELLARVKVHLELKQTRDTLLKTLEQLHRLATTDALTGVANRRLLFELGHKMLGATQRHNQPLSLLMIDIDHFKQINDTYGHPVGDQVLQKLVEALQENLRQEDLLGRLGGEEFTAILPLTDLDSAHAVAERCRQQVAALDIQPALLQHSSIHITISIGVAARCAQDTTIDSLISRADHALYEAKRQGRNQVVGQAISLS
jgi:diguanylate cyclase (GGDEF)-like protein